MTLNCNGVKGDHDGKGRIVTILSSVSAKTVIFGLSNRMKYMHHQQLNVHILHEDLHCNGCTDVTVIHAVHNWHFQ